MGDGKHCPSCGKDIGVWPVFSAAWPTWIWCPWCKSRLRYRHTADVIAVLVVVLIAIAVGASVLVATLVTTRRRLIWATAVIICWVPVQLVVSWFLRNRRELELAAQSRTES
jgi:uncharacterized protein (DUF983 family)